MKKRMTPTALKALQGSIRKWQKIVAGTGRENGDENCPLCKVFLEKGCKGCPVAKFTGRKHCEATPYRTDWARHAYPDYATSDGEILAAVKELRFLIALLP